jgi:hypothetical protein
LPFETVGLQLRDRPGPARGVDLISGDALHDQQDAPQRLDRRRERYSGVGDAEGRGHGERAGFDPDLRCHDFVPSNTPSGRRFRTSRSWRSPSRIDG